MKLFARFVLLILLPALALMLVACGGAGGGDAHDGADHTGKDKPVDGRAQGMEHGKKSKSGGMSGMKGMDHGSGGMASGMLMKNGKYSDERFIDAMVPHHEGAVDMARVALKNAEHPEIEQLAGNIIATQRAEIRELESIKQEQFGTSRVPKKTSTGQMESMGMMVDPQSLADENPFDKAFIDNMIPHHQSAISMAEAAHEKSDNPRIKELATNILGAQRHEISQMKRWREQWYQDA